jgi:hypothetical protein
LKLLPFVLAVAALGAGTPGAAETGPWEGQSVTLKLPTVYLSKGRSGLLEDRPTYIVDLVQEVGRVSPWGAPQWRTAGFPDLGHFDVTKIKRKKNEYTEVELKSEERVVKLRFLTSVEDLSAAFAEVTVTGPPEGPRARAYLESVFPLLAGELLEGGLADFPEPVRVALVKTIHDTGGQARLGTEEYQGRSYVVARLGRIQPQTRVFVSNPVARAAIFMNEQLLTAGRRFWAALGEAPGYDGLKIEADLPRRGTAEREEEASDHLQWFAPRGDLARFAVDEITSADLLDASVVLLEGNRVALPLDVAR